MHRYRNPVMREIRAARRQQLLAYALGAVAVMLPIILGPWWSL